MAEHDETSETPPGDSLDAYALPPSYPVPCAGRGAVPRAGPEGAQRTAGVAVIFTETERRES